MQGSDTKKVIINTTFTLLILGLLFMILLESRLYFNSNLRQIRESLKSGIESYKVKYAGEMPEIGYDISSISKLSIYDKNPLKIVQKLQNVHEFENNSIEETAQLPKEIESDILENPLFKGYYIQLGIFANKVQAQESIQNVLEKSIIDENFVTYIETKMLQEKPFYLAQVGVFSSKNDAIFFCDKLQKSGIGCLIID